MRGKFITIWSVAVLFILLQADVTLSRRGGSRSRSRSRSRSSSTNRGSQHESSKPVMNSEPSAEETGHLAYGASASHHNQKTHIHHNNPSSSQYNPSYPQNGTYSQYNHDIPLKFDNSFHRLGYPENAGFPNYGGDSSWDQYYSKPWKPKPSKHKAMALAVAAGTNGDFLLGPGMSAMHFHFNGLDEERWWHENRDNYPDRVYFPWYEQPVPEDVFVRDCWNITMRGFVAPSGTETADEMETRVVGQVVHQMCAKQYHVVLQHSIGDSAWDTHRMRPGSGAALTGAAGEAAGTYGLSRHILTPIALFYLPAFLCY
nr:major prion protein homolog [Pogona vitticeps]